MPRPERSKRCCNRVILAEAVLLWLSSLGCLYLLISGRYLDYVTAAAKIWLLLAAVVLMLWGWLGFRLRGTFRHQRSAVHLLVLIIPLLLLISPHRTFSAADLSSQPVDSLTAGVRGSEKGGAAVQPPGADGSAQDRRKERKGLRWTDKGEIEIDQHNFYAWMMELYRAPESYEGKKLTILGYISGQFSSDDKFDFAIFRPVMACCAADMMPLGLICRNQTIIQPADGQWYRVSGTIQAVQREKRLMPVLGVVEIEPADKPNPEYVTAGY